MKYTITLVLLTFLIASLVNALPAVKRATKYAIQVKSATAFCSFMPPHPGNDVGGTENNGIPFCTSANLGGKVFPTGFIKSAHYVSTSAYSQITGKIDRSKYSLKSSDGGGQYDNKDISSATCNGYKYFVNLIEPDANVFCIRCCKSQADCNLGISTYGCSRVVPGNYS